MTSRRMIVSFSILICMASVTAYSIDRPCDPSPCGPNSKCDLYSGNPACTCLIGYLGAPPSCRACALDSTTDCASDKACINDRCVDPCPGVCGDNAQCKVVNHKPTCSCPEGSRGDPLRSCSKIEILAVPIENPCEPSPCGPNSQCGLKSGIAACTCLIGYLGAPPSCRACALNSATDCASDKACINDRCVDPCPGVCGDNAQCKVVNHVPTCSCPEGSQGDPFRSCSKIESKVAAHSNSHPCQPSPCGPNSKCDLKSGHPVCSCLIGYLGAPPSCRACALNTDCALDKACALNKCYDPCPETCGKNAECKVVDHLPICNCPEGLLGDPFVSCSKEESKVAAHSNSHPCTPSPCGLNSKCDLKSDRPVCSCLIGYLGAPPSCRACALNSDCDLDKACASNKCVDPCPETCGKNAECKVVNHHPICSCPEGFQGDPFVSCSKEESKVAAHSNSHPCQPSPCGPNSKCDLKSGRPVCSCLIGYLGAPPSCRACALNSDCGLDKACALDKCVDPCPGSCGTNAECKVVNHHPICSCPEGFQGDAFVSCSKEESRVAAHSNSHPCTPSPCGPNSKCDLKSGHPVCSCLIGYLGAPPSCRACALNSDCGLDKACALNKCVDPCPETCGKNAECKVVNHHPICSCPEGFQGDAFVSCSNIQI